MRNVLLKSTASGELALQNPGTPIGHRDGVITYAVTDVPDEVCSGDVLRLADKTVFIGSGFTIEYDKLGAGRVARL